MEHQLSILLIIGVLVLISFYAGKSVKFAKLPSLIGYMILGVLAGPSLTGIVDHHLQNQLGFITDVALGFVALSIGIELKMSSLKKLGSGIISIIFMESFAAFLFVFTLVAIVTRNIPLALIFGGIAPASAPAGTVAIIQEYKAKGSLTKALYAIVGFDDGLGIIIFGFASAVAHQILVSNSGESVSMVQMLIPPFKEIALSLIIGSAVAVAFSLLLRFVKNSEDVLILIFGTVLAVCGVSQMWHLSLILTNMIIGMVIVNTQPHSVVQQIHDRLPVLMPILFILFFTLAGANLHIAALPSLGIIGLVYIIGRSSGLILGSKLGALLGKVEDKIRKYVGLGILSQAGVAIGLSLIVKQDFAGIGPMMENSTGQMVHTGDWLGTTVLTTVTATCIFFELIGPVLTRIALLKAGEIKETV